MASIPFLPHLGVSSNGDVVNVDASQRQSFTLTSKSPFKSSILSHKSSFTVQFQKKDARTAIGLASFQPPQVLVFATNRRVLILNGALTTDHQNHLSFDTM